MFKGHPKGLYVLFFSNMGERFGYYTMIAILMLYVQAKFGLDNESAGNIWSLFLFGVYFMPLFGGMLADKYGYGKIIVFGIIFMFIGYALMAVPGTGLLFIYISLAVIAVGTGFFKGNLVVLLGNLYESKGYKKLHSAAFSIFYMGINIGAFYAPHAATGIRDFLMKKSGFIYNENIPHLAHQFLDGTITSTHQSALQTFAQGQTNYDFTTLGKFSHDYITAIGQSYNAGFAIAAASIIVSLLIFLGFKKYYKKADYIQKDKIATGEAVELTPKQTKDRIIALSLIFFVVIFFWMAFHQNGYTLTFFARDYTVSSVGKYTYMLFDLLTLHGFFAIILGLVFLFGKNYKQKTKLIGAAVLLLGIFIVYWRLIGFSNSNSISAELFQHFNPYFIILFTFVIVSFFSWLNKRGKEPSSPAKIGIGMAIAGAAYLIMVIASFNLQSPLELKQSVSPVRLSPYPLIGTYFGLTIAELFLSPMGLAFVAKVAPPKYKGLMQGGWLAATAIGTLLSGRPIGYLYDRLELWQTFLVLSVLCILAALFIVLVYKKLMRAVNS